MRIFNYFGINEHDFRYHAVVTWESDIKEYTLDYVTSKGKRCIDCEVYLFNEYNDNWEEIDQDSDLFHELEIEDKLTEVINSQFDEADWLLHDRGE